MDGTDKTALKAVFWDMDGTLIDSEPYWHQGELKIAAEHGGYWDEELAWGGSGRPVPQIAQEMVDLGCKLPAEEIGRQMIQYVTDAEMKKIPWIPGTRELLIALREAGIPSVLVTTSPRALAQNLIAQAPEGVFAGYICGEDDVKKKPDPEPYLAAAAKVGVSPDQMAQCIAFEDSASGLRSAVDSGATVIAQLKYMRNSSEDGPQFKSIRGYDDITVSALQAIVQERNEQLEHC